MSRLTSFAAGLERHGLKHDVVMRHEPVCEWDVLVVNSGYYPGYPKNLPLKRAQASGTPYINIGNGFYRKNVYHGVSWNGGIKGQGDFCNAGSPTDRWADHGLQIKPWRSAGDHVVLCCQVPTDPSVAGIDIFAWCAQAARTIRKHSDRRIVFRPHPLSRDITPGVPDTVRSEETFDHDLRDAHAVVTYNSASSALAILDGIPIFVDDDASPALPVANRDLAKIETPDRPVREQWAHDLAYAQWSLDEMASGECWEHVGLGLSRHLRDRN